jgi:hypothetical protein
MRRAMVGQGLDATDPDQRTRYADTLQGQMVRLSAELEGLVRVVIAPLGKLLPPPEEQDHDR